MYLTPRETDKLMLHLAGQVAMERKARGLKLNYPERSLISAHSFWNWQETDTALPS